MGPTQKKLGLIGLSAKGSWASRSHLPYLQQTPHYIIAALQNSSLSAAKAAAEAYSLPSVHTHDSAESLASDPDVDIVVVSVNAPSHYTPTMAAINAGKDVFVEWPLGSTLAQAEEMAALAKEKGVRTLVGLQAKQNPSIQKAKELVDSGRLGKILATRMHGQAGFLGALIFEEMAYALPLEAGANLVTIPAGHALDALCYVLGEMEYVSAELVNHFPEVSVVNADGKEVRREKKTAHDFLSLSGKLVDSGAVVSVTYEPGTRATGSGFYWEIIGSEGTLILENSINGHAQMFQPSVKLVVGGGAVGLGFVPAGSGPEVVEVEKAEEFSFNVGKAWDAWAGVGDGPVTTFDDAVLRHKMIEAIYRSNETGKREKYL